MPPKPLDRGELWALRDHCEVMAKAKSLPPAWQRGYLALADAADRLDAMTARHNLDSKLGIKTNAPKAPAKTKKK